MLKRFTLGRTFGSQLALFAAILMAPLILLSALFVRESRRNIDFVERELQGVRYLSAMWPEFNAAAAGAPEPRASRLAFDAVARDLDPSLRTAQESARFATARTPAAKAETGASLIRKVADNSNLTLDTDLDTFYLMDAATVRLPALAQVGTEIVRADGATRASGEQLARLAASAAVVSLDRAIDRAPAETRQKLAGRTAALNASTAALATATLQDVTPAHASGIAEAQQRLQREIDTTWRASTAQLAHLLQARRARLLVRLWSSLAFVMLFVAASAAVAWTIARRLAVRVRDLEGALTRLTAGDLAVDIPYRGDRSEIGRIATGVEAFKHASADKARLMRELETAYATLQDAQSWLKLALTTGRMGAWRRKFRQDEIDLSPELAGLLGFPADMNVTIADIEPLFLDRKLLPSWSAEAKQVAAGELDKLTLEEAVTPFRRFDTGEIRWALVRREMIFDPAPQVVGVGIDITDRKHMMDELNHRVKNNLATVLSLAMQTAKSASSLQDFMKVFTVRVQVLAKINELATRHGWGQIKLKDVLTTTLRPWRDAGVEFAAGSPEQTEVSSRAAVSLCLVLNELATNAAQRGALAADGGRVEIAWAEPYPEHGVLSWIERSTRATTPPSGFGATLIQRLVAGDLGGRADLDFRPEGLTATLTFALQGATA